MEHVYDIDANVENKYGCDKVKVSLTSNAAGGEHTVSVNRVDTEGRVINEREPIVHKVFAEDKYELAVAYYEDLLNQLYERAEIRKI